MPFADADRLHSRANIAKMSAGTPLDDDDRRPWLAAVARWLVEHEVTGGVVACSALLRRYRDVLTASAPQAWFLYLRRGPRRPGPSGSGSAETTSCRPHFSTRSSR